MSQSDYIHGQPKLAFLWRCSPSLAWLGHVPLSTFHSDHDDHLGPLNRTGLRLDELRRRVVTRPDAGRSTKKEK